MEAFGNNDASVYFLRVIAHGLSFPDLSHFYDVTFSQKKVSMSSMTNLLPVYIGMRMPSIREWTNNMHFPICCYGQRSFLNSFYNALKTLL